MIRLRLGIVAAAVAAVGHAATLAACGSMSGAASFGSGGEFDAGGSPDAGGPDVTSAGDAGDGAADAPPSDADAAGLEPPGVLFVQGSPDLPDLRFCWAVGGAGPSTTQRAYPWATPMPASNYPGVPVGGAVGLADASSMLGGPLTIYAIDARAIANVERFADCSDPHACSCAAIMNTSGSGVDTTAIHTMPTIPDGSIVAGSTVLLSVRGCYGTAYDPAATTQRCGADWTSTAGNLRIDVTSIPGASLPAPDGGVLAVQAAQLSPALTALAGDAGAVVSFGAQGASDASVIATLSSLDQILPSAPQQVAAKIPLSSFGKLGFSVDVGGDAGAHVWTSLAQSLDLVDPTQNPTQYFAQPTTYVVALVGYPGGAPPGASGDAAYDGTGLHVLVLPLP